MDSCTTKCCTEPAERRSHSRSNYPNVIDLGPKSDHCLGFPVYVHNVCTSYYLAYCTYSMLSRAANRNSRMYQQISGRTASLPGWKAVLGVSSTLFCPVVTAIHQSQSPPAVTPLWGPTNIPHCVVTNTLPRSHRCPARAQIFLPSLLAFVVLDGIWIGLVASDFYMSRCDAPAVHQ
jgi:hypothetical protein